jgi:hypothetical protein
MFSVCHDLPAKLGSSDGENKHDMKKLMFCFIASLALWQVSAAENQWLTDMAKAQAQAKTENKLILLDFTGSDW